MLYNTPMPEIFVEHKSTEQPKDEPQAVAPLHTEATKSVSALMHERPHSIGLFAAYGTHPKGINFANQESDEVVLLFLRRHFITNIPWILTTIVGTLVPPALFVIAQLLQVFPFSIPMGLTIVVTAFYYLLLMGYAFGKFVSWFYNIGIVTQKRLVDLDTSNILAHNTAAAGFNELVDVKFTQKGFFESFFDYGDILIQTEAIHANFEFDASPHPTQVTDIISDLRVAQKGYRANT